MPQHLVPWSLLAALIACCTPAAAAWNLGRKRKDEAGEPGADAPVAPLPGELQGLDERLVNVAAKFRTLSESNQQLSAQLKSCTSQLHLAQAEIGSLKDERARQFAQREFFEVQLQERQQELERGTAHARALEVELSSQARGIESTTRQLARLDELLTTRIVELEARSAASQQELAQRSEALLAAERRAAELDAGWRSQTAELLEARRIEEELRQQLEQQAAAGRALAARVGAFESQLAQRDAELRRQAAAERQVEARVKDRERSQSIRIDELESELAQREQELRGRATELEGLRHQLGIHSGRGDERAQRCAELEGELRLRLEEQGRFEGRARELEHELAACAADSQVRVGRVEAESRERSAALEVELRERSAAQEALRGELAALAEELCQRTEAQRAGELRLRESEAQAAQREIELQERHAQLESLRGDLARGSSQGEALARHCAELEDGLRAREEQLQALRGEFLTLADGGAAQDAALEARAEELRERERRMARQDARVRELELAAEQHAAQQRLDLVSLGEIAEGRIATVLEGNAGESPVPLPEAYLLGIEQRDLALALCGLLGGPEPLSGAALVRLSEHWREQHSAWRFERIEGEVVYLWADAPFVRTGLEPEGSALLVIVAGMVDGTRRVVWVEAGARDSESAWLGALDELARRGMNVPRLVVGEDGLGIWPALARIGWNCGQQRSWDRRIEHVVDALPKRQQRLAGEQLRRIARSGTRAEANRLKEAFVARHRKRRPEAVARIEADWECLVGLYSFPADHWPHLRTTAVVESLLSQLRLQTSVAKSGTPTPNAQSILWKLLLVGARGLRKLNSPQLLPAVAAADRCVDGVLGGRSRKRAA